MTVEYKLIDGVPTPQRVDSVVTSTQHDEEVGMDAVREGLMEHVVRFVIPKQHSDDKTVYHMQLFWPLRYRWAPTEMLVLLAGR